MENEQTEYLGTEMNGVDRPEITLENLNVSSVDKPCILNGSYDNVRILMTPSDSEVLSFEIMFCYLVDQVCNGNDVYPQPVNLFLIIDDSMGDRKYYMGADVQIDDWNGITTEESMVEIHPTNQEQAAIELSLLKVVDPEQYWVRYSRSRVGNLEEIKNRLGFVMDEIDENDLYKSTWISPDYKIIALGCIPNAHCTSSKIQFVQVGT